MYLHPAFPASICAAIALCLVWLPTYADGGETPAVTAPSKPASVQVVFVCEHGSVKSLIAASLFERAAAERGLPFTALSRGIAPDAHVPAAIAAALARDGFDVTDVKPQAVTPPDLSGATRVVTIGVELAHERARTPAESWDDVPPASKDYAAARAALQRHIDALLDDLAAEQAH